MPVWRIHCGTLSAAVVLMRLIRSGPLRMGCSGVEMPVWHGCTQCGRSGIRPGGYKCIGASGKSREGDRGTTDGLGLWRGDLHKCIPKFRGGGGWRNRRHWMLGELVIIVTKHIVKSHAQNQARLMLGARWAKVPHGTIERWVERRSIRSRVVATGRLRGFRAAIGKSVRLHGSPLECGYAEHRAILAE
ncbi:hypothetical protein BGW80DRAFT_1250117 [Lactifluus volemus]|nr:hypothetical protein BGW80DRAFT_1250117 [Lactifluus volemus]